MNHREWIQYSTPLEDEKQRIVSDVLAWGSGGYEGVTDLDSFESLVAIKSIERSYTQMNKAFRSLFCSGRSLIGQNTDSMLDPKFRKLSQETDGLIIEGVSHIELEHVAVLPDGQCCVCVTYKRRLDEIQDPNYLILLIARPLYFVASSEMNKRLSVGELLRKFLELDDIDQAICRCYAKGDSSKEIAEQVGLTKRAIELRRQKIMRRLEFSRPVEIIKMLVRLEEWGML